MDDARIKAALSEFDTFFLTVWAEGRGEPVEGQIAIANVIRNRAHGPARFGASYKAVCLKPMQFSCWNAGTDRNHVRLMELAESLVDDYAVRSIDVIDPAMKQIRYIVAGVMGGHFRDEIGGADHYLTTALFTSHPPSWARGQTPCAFKGGHAFLKLG